MDNFTHLVVANVYYISHMTTCNVPIRATGINYEVIQRTEEHIKAEEDAVKVIVTNVVKFD